MSSAFSDAADTILYSFKYASLTDFKMAVREVFQNSISNSEFDSTFDTYTTETSDFLSNEIRSHISDMMPQFMVDRETAALSIVHDIKNRFPPESLALYQIFSIDIDRIANELVSTWEGLGDDN